MPTILKCTAMFGADVGPSWSETHHLLVPDPLGPLLGYMNSFLAFMSSFRKPLLGADRYIVGVRVSYRTATKDVKSSPFKLAQVLRPNTTDAGTAPAVALKIRMGEQGNSQFSDIYMRGFWDVVEQNEELNFTVDARAAAFKQLLDTYISQLVTQKYGWVGMKEATTRRGVIESFTNPVGGFVEFTLTKETGPVMPAVGSVVEFRAARLNESTSPLNRTLICEVVSPTVVRTVERIAAGPFFAKGTWVIPGRDFLQYTGQQYLSLNRRAPGARFFQSPGRRKATPRF